MHRETRFLRKDSIFLVSNIIFAENQIEDKKISSWQINVLRLSEF